MPRCHLVLLAAVLLGPGLPARAQFGPPQPATAPGVDKELTQRWQVGVIIEAPGGPSAGLFGTLPVPTEWPEQKVKIVGEEVSPLVSRISYRDLGGVKQMLFTIPQLPHGQTAKAVVTLEVTKSSQIAPENPAALMIPKTPPTEIRPHLAASPGIDCRDNDVRDKAQELVAGKSTAWEQVEAMYDWVRDNVQYREGKFKGAATALREKFGSKHDLTALFIALCRAHKVPARTVWVPDHAYAEFYLQDAQGQGHWYPCQVAGTREFGGISDLRPVLQKGDNIRVPENREPQRFVAEYLTGKGGRGMGQPRVEFVRKLLPAN